MNPQSTKKAAKLLAAASLLLFALSTAAMLRKMEPFYTNYYSLAWWSYILFLQSALYWKTGKSLLFDSPAKFVLLLPLSVTVWLFFEALNFRLSNWHYINMPPDTFERWTGYLIAYSTVLPGIFATMELLESAGLFKNYRCNPLSGARRLYRPLTIAGAVFFMLPLVWPRFFFPLVWVSLIFLLEPINHRYGAPSFLRDWEKGSPRNFSLLLASGLVCGLLWELWNFKAGAKWIYTVPFVGSLKIFEMPALGFLGFPPFAVECFAVTSSFLLLAGRIKAMVPGRKAMALYLVGAALIVLFDLLVFAGIDRLTVLSYQAVSG